MRLRSQVGRADVFFGIMDRIAERCTQTAQVWNRNAEEVEEIL